jgi:site-specific recombinase XerD
VRCPAKRVREKDVLTLAEFAALIAQLEVRERAMVMLAGSTGLRRSEFIGLRWSDIDARKQETGRKPISPDTVLKKIIRSALKQAGIVGKVIGWHLFRHSPATNLRSLGVDIKVAQELLRHANSRTTMDIYTQAVSAQKHEATGRVVDLLLAQTTKGAEPQHPSEPSESRLAVA